jgi:hypothetical protein
MAVKLLSKSEFMEAIAPIDALTSYAAPSDQWRFGVEDDRVVARANGSDFRISKEGLEAALAKVPGLAKAAVQQWPVDMLLSTVNFFYEHGEGEAAAMVEAGDDGDTIVGFTKDARPIVPVGQVLDIAERSLKKIDVPTKDLQFSNVRASRENVAFGLVNPNVAEEPKVGDVVQAGLWFMHSPIHKRSTEVSSFLNRLACTNGMIAPRTLSKFSYRGGSTFNEWVDQAVLDGWSALNREFDGLRELTQQPLNGHAHSVVEDLFERHHVPASLRETVLNAVIDEADGTMYGIAQAFNRAANLVDDTSHMRSLLMVTGDIVAQDERCGSCFRAL